MKVSLGVPCLIQYSNFIWVSSFGLVDNSFFMSVRLFSCIQVSFHVYKSLFMYIGLFRGALSY